MKAGLLYASSHAHPAIGSDFLQTVRSVLKQGTNDSLFDLHVESVGFGGNEKEVYEKAERMLLEQDVDVLAAFLDLKVLPILQPLFFSTDKLIVIVNAGANYPGNWVPAANCLYLSLQHAFLTRLTATCFSIQRSAAGIATDFYNAGYLHTAAMANGWMQAGGSIAFNYVDRSRNENEFSLTELFGWLDQNPNTTQLLCLFDAKKAALFYKQLAAYPGASQLSLYVSPMMLEKEALAAIDEGLPFSIYGYAPWPGAFQNRNGENDFVKHESIFGLLGIETANIFSAIHGLYEPGVKQTSDIVAQLLSTSIDSPRGALRLDEDTHYYTGPVYEYRVDALSGNVRIEQKPHPKTDWEQFTSEEIQGVVSGWTNTFLCY